jgi:hypothetical protein
MQREKYIYIRRLKQIQAPRRKNFKNRFHKVMLLIKI